ncbi:MAG: gliding motility-associated C-terminal domain-containing protein, partial [Chitinophagia bacterium]|nr:gliding motility-associated C-terminal domain-containing protein [Chitinophagia bacterium]
TSPGDVYNYVSQTINGCESPRSTVLVRVTPKPTAGFNWVIAYGCTADTVQFINTSSNTTASFWYFGDTLALPEQEFSPVHLYPAANQAYQRNVKLVVYNGGCADSVVNTLNFLKNPNPPFRLSQVTPNQAITFGGSVQLNAGGATLYYWKPNDGSLNDANINNPIASPRQATTYTVYGYDASGCLDSAQVNIDVVTAATDYIPSAFTPNGDSKNDVFRIVGRPYERLVEMSIYNRWGEKVFSSNDIHKGWDGTWNGVPQDIGVYYYAIIIATQEGTNKTFSGPVTLIR